MKKFFLVVLACLSLLVAGCDSARNPKNVKRVVTSEINYGNGVYYFPYTESDFGNALSSFIQEHPEYEVVSMASNGTTAYGVNQGYFVIVKKK